MNRTFVKCKLVEKEKNETEKRMAISLEAARKENILFEEKKNKQILDK